MLSNILAGGALGPCELAVGGANIAKTNQKNQFSDFFFNVAYVHIQKVKSCKVLMHYTNIKMSVTPIT